MGFDPEPIPEVYIAANAAARVEGLVGPPGIAARINQLSHEKVSKEEIAFTIAREIVEGKFGPGSPEELGEQALRSSLAVLTEGIVAAPIEGISAFKIRKFQNEEFVAVYYAGPIRAAGGTAAAVSILLTDYIRQLLKVPPYKATEAEIERMVEEVHAYKKKVNLQIPTTEEQMRFAMSHVPIQINGEPTEDVEVVGYRDLPRIETNQLRGGACLVFNDGLVGRAKKLLKRVKMVGLEGWDWLAEVDKLGKLEGQGTEKNNKSAEKNQEQARHNDHGQQKKQKSNLDKGIVHLEPSDGYLRDVIGGRPVFGHPSRKGGFRLRYGRARHTGIAGVGIHPATMAIVNDFLATGTHIRTERPGKGSIVVPVSTVEPPIVMLKNGDVVRTSTYEEAKAILPQIKRVLFLGDMLVSAAEYVQNNYKLNPAGYCEEWWALEVRQATREKRDYKTARKPFVEDPLLHKPSVEEAILLSKQLNIPLHPFYTPFFDLLEPEEALIFYDLASEMKNKQVTFSERYKKVLERAWIPHKILEGKIKIDDSIAEVLKTLFQNRPKLEPHMTTIELINASSPIKIRPRGGTFIGARMGRPEKASDRKMRPPVHGLFPIGNVGGPQRDLNKAIGKTVEEEIQLFTCPKCNKTTYHRICIKCKERTAPRYKCRRCGKQGEEEICQYCGEKTRAFEKITIDLDQEINRVKAKIGSLPSPVKLVKKLMSPTRSAEPLEKAILRARHEVTIFRDGTIRFDSTNAPLTHFIPKEIGTDIRKLVELGYTHDIYGQPLTSPEQILELKVQDVIINSTGADFLVKVAKFIDDELKELYGLEPFYNAETRNDLVGQLIIGLAPHTSAGIIGRIIGFTDAKVSFAHPYWHAAKRRNCDSDEDAAVLLMDGLLNFSKAFLPDRRGSRMDAPLVLVVNLDPLEVDDEAHNLDCNWEYPLELYFSSWREEDPSIIEALLDNAKKRLETNQALEGIGYTHWAELIHEGPISTLYKRLKSMGEKVDAQLHVAKILEAVDLEDVARRVIEKHFLPDILGNLRKFGAQKFRCTGCNASYRRVPLNGRCRKCGEQKISPTIYKKSVTKYFDLSFKLAIKYNLSNYMKGRLESLRLGFEENEEEDKDKVVNLGSFLG